MDNALLLYIKKILGNLEEINLEFDSVKNTVNNIEVTVNDIYTGNSVTDWIADLVENGTSSDTYKDASRMALLCENKAACTNPSINTILFNYAVSNSLNVGNFYNQLLGSVSGVNWSSLSTISSISANSAAFSAVANNASAFEMFFNNSQGKQSLWTNRATTQNILASSSVATTEMKKHQEVKSMYLGMSGSHDDFTENMFVLSGRYSTERSNWHSKLVLYNNASSVYSYEYYGTEETNINKFVTRGEFIWGLGTSAEIKLYHIKF